MFDNRNTIKFLSDKDVDEFLLRCTNVKYRLGALIMLDCGLRITELCHLRIKDCNWQEKKIYVKSLKKGKNKDGAIREVWRTVYMSDRVIKCAADYFLKFNNAKDNRYVNISDPNAYLFPSPIPTSKGNPISRVMFWKYYDSVSDGRVYNHLMRHTFATRSLDSGTDLYTLKELLGHGSIQMTEIYAHVRDDKKRDAAVRLETYQDSPFKHHIKRLFPSLFRIKNVHVLPTQKGWINCHVGRKDEMILIYSLIEKKVNMLVKGEQSIGKSHILENIQGDKILRVSDTRDFKKTLGGMLLQIIEEDKPTFSTKDILALESKEVQDTAAGSWEVDSKPINAKEMLMEMLEKKKENIQKYSAKAMIDLLIELTSKSEYTIIIDTIDHITPSVVSHLEFMRNHFHFIVAARQVKLEHATWLSNFQKVEIKALSHAECIDLIVRASEDFRQRIEDWEIYKTHIIQKCGGNPGFILELIDRFRKEDFVSKNKVYSLDFANAARQEFSMTPFLFAGLMILIIGKFWAREATPWDKEAWMFIAAIALCILFFGRNARTKFKRKYV